MTKEAQNNQIISKLVHGSNLYQKESHLTKYRDERSIIYLHEIREKYNEWRKANMELTGPRSMPTERDQEILMRRIELLEQYEKFIDQQHYAEKFDSRSNLYSSVLEEFMYYLFKDLVADLGEHALIDYEEVAVTTASDARLLDISGDVAATVAGSESHLFDVPAVAIECKTYLDKTMLEGSSRAAEEIKARHPNGLYIVVMEYIKLTEAVNLRKYKVDQIYVLRKQKNTDREFRYAPTYKQNSIDYITVKHLFETVRTHLVKDWTGDVASGLERGWLIE